MEREELAAWLRLTLTPGVGNEAGRRLLAAFGLPAALFAQPEEALREVVSPALAAALQEVPPTLQAQLDTALQWLAQDGEAPRRIVTLGDASYPPSLLASEDPPLLLYVIGNATLAGEASRIAIVGSRNATPQGLDNARQFAQSFGEAGLCVVSGLALGIDSAAHEGALDGGGETIAVVGTGLDRVYPKRNLALARRIVQRGALVSEYPLGTPPLPQNFPRRNRIIAGLAQGTLVVEAALKSGSLITARMAAEQGTDVFAIPGSIHSPQSRGCHSLIKQGAKLVECAQDVLEELRIPLPPGMVATAAAAEEAEGPLLEHMGYEAVSLDALSARTGIGAAGLQAGLLELELEGRVRRLPGGLFQRIAHG
jgi:DNA processing protein